MGGCCNAEKDGEVFRARSKRGCTDLLCLVGFVCGMGGIIGLTIVSVNKQPSLLTVRARRAQLGPGVGARGRHTIGRAQPLASRRTRASCAPHAARRAPPSPHPVTPPRAAHAFV